MKAGQKGGGAAQTIGFILFLGFETNWSATIQEPPFPIALDQEYCATKQINVDIKVFFTHRNGGGVAPDHTLLLANKLNKKANTEKDRGKRKRLTQSHSPMVTRVCGWMDTS